MLAFAGSAAAAGRETGFVTIIAHALARDLLI